MPLDLAKLQNVRPGSGGSTTAGCPACMEGGRDHTRDHLIIYPDGRYGCIANQGDAEHRSRIWALAGTGADENASFEPPPEPVVTLPKVWPASVLSGLIQDYTYWAGRGISAETVAPFRGGVATRYQMKNRWVFPQFNEDDEIIGFSGRALSPSMQPKWKHLAPSSRFVWGGLDEIRETRRAILCESIGDVLALREHGVPEALCIFGLNMSQAVLGFLISANPAQIIVSTNRDADPAKGQRAAARISETLLRFFDESCVSVVRPESKDWGEASAEQIHAAFLAPAPAKDTAPEESTADSDIDS